MDKIFTVPGRETKRWIEINDAQTELSEIKIENGFCYVPFHIYEDSLIDIDEISELTISDDIMTNNGFVLFPESCFDLIQEARDSSYRACIWYNEIVNKIPTADSILLSIKSKEQLREHLAKYIHEYPFVRLCTMSPKDVKPIPVYTDSDYAFNDLFLSERTNNVLDKPYCQDCCGKHLFMRKKREYLWEVRCFWSRGKLRAVSLPPYYDFSVEEKSSIIDFFNNYGKHFPYHSATVDIGKVGDSLELIEFNSFGPDMKATAGNFSWREDVMTLLFSSEPCFR